MSDILYVCDQTKCENCSATDVTHAKNFSYDGVADIWYEDPRKTKSEEETK